jgi:hypothetical protein
MSTNLRPTSILLSFSLFALLACGGEPTGLSDPPAEDNVLFGVHHNLTIDGRLLARIQADSLYHRKGSRAMLLWTPDIDFSPAYPEGPPALRGNQLVINHYWRRLTLRGNAVFEMRSTGYRLQGEEIQFGYGEGWLFADSASLSWPDDEVGATPIAVVKGFKTSAVPRLLHKSNDGL